MAVGVGPGVAFLRQSGMMSVCPKKTVSPVSPFSSLIAAIGTLYIDEMLPKVSVDWTMTSTFSQAASVCSARL